MSFFLESKKTKWERKGKKIWFFLKWGSKKGKSLRRERKISIQKSGEEREREKERAEGGKKERRGG